jgi:UDP-glucose 4-epimerase
MNLERVAIVGSGFIGSSLAGHLCKEYPVVTIDVNPQPPQLAALGVEHRICDVRDYEKLKAALSDAAVVIHTSIIQIPAITEKRELAYEVNVLGTQNACRIAAENPGIRGLLLPGSWHVFGEQRLEGSLDEASGYRPDRVEPRARLYALSKIAQECIVRFYDEKTDGKIFGIIRMGTVLGDGMPKETAANLFITKALNGEAITPYKHSMHRPMLYTAIEDICHAFETYVRIVLAGGKQGQDSFQHIVNVAYPEPITILDLANIVKDSVTKRTDGRIAPEVTVVDKGLPDAYAAGDKDKLRLDATKAKEFLGLAKLTSPQEAIDGIVQRRLQASG